MALPAIQGASFFFAGANSTYTNATGGGTWSSGNVSIATINSSTGVATGVASGNTQIIYTVGDDSTAINIAVQANAKISNGFNPTQCLSALSNEVLWRSQGTSNSGRYFQDFHPICDETILESLAQVSEYDNFADFLSSLNNSVILETLNCVYDYPQLIDKSKLVFGRSDIMLVTQPVQPQSPGQFVGLKMAIAPGDFGIKLNKLMLFFTENVTFTMYLYNDFNLPPLFQIQVTAQAYQQTVIDLNNSAIMNYLTPDSNEGGIFYFGYYQEDLGSAQAIYYPIVINTFRPVAVWSFSAPVVIDALGHTNFNRTNIGANNLTYGLNLEIATMVDATNNICTNPSLYDNLIGLKMACKVVEMCKFSYRSNGVQRVVEALGGLDGLNVALNGTPGNYFENKPKSTGLIQMVNQALKTVKQGFQPLYKGSIGTMGPS